MATYFWVGGTGTWDGANAANWSLTSGGAGGAGVPNSTDIVNFNSLSGTGTCTTAAGSACATATLNSTVCALTLGANHTMSGTFTFTAGTLTLSSFTLSCAIFLGSNANTRTLDFGTGNITVTGNNNLIYTTGNRVGMTVLGTPVVNATYAGATGTRTINLDNGSGTFASRIALNVTAGTDIVTTTGNINGSLDFTGFAGTWALGSFASTYYGDIKLNSSMTLDSGTGTLQTFAGTSGIQKITSAGKTFNNGITQNGVGGTVQLQDNLTMGSTRTYTLTNGVLDLVSRTLSTGLFSSTNSNVRSIAFGTGNITLTGNAGTIFTTQTITNFTCTGTPTINCTYAGSTGTRTIIAGAATTESNALNFNITAGTDIVTIYFAVRNLDFTGFAGTLTLISSSVAIYGDVTISSGMTVTAAATQLNFVATSGVKTFTTNNVPLDLNFLFNSSSSTVRLVGNLTSTTTKACFFVSGTLDLNNNTFTIGSFSSAYSTARTIAFGTGNITLIGSATVWNTGTTTNFAYTGTPTVNISNNSATATTVTTGALTEAQSLNFNYSVGTYTLTDTNSVYKSVNFTGFAGTIPNSVRTIYGNLTLVVGMTLTAGANTTTFASTSAGNTITSAGKTQDYPITFNGVGGVWTCQDALTLGATRALTMTNGTLNLKSGATSTVGSFVTTGANQKFLGSSTPGTQATISDASGVNSANYLTISDSFATGGADWEAFYANNNVDAGNNSNWDFGATPILGTEYTYTLRSFTQPRRF